VNDVELRIVNPPFESPLTDLIIDLDHLRKKLLYGSTKPMIFFQLKNIFHMLESIASARIEGNNTTIAEYIETKISGTPGKQSEFVEIQNMEQCLEFIDKHVTDSRIDRAFISELHKMVVKELPAPPNGEGDRTPGVYRADNVKIKNSPHVPPDAISVQHYMEELLKFIEYDDKPKYDLLKIAIAHHRFVWIHPFRNGNGRTVRLFTYAMLVKYGFNVSAGRILNPAAVFCNNRAEYYDKLSQADRGTDNDILSWCEYVLKGLRIEIEKIDNLLEYTYLKSKILLPAISYSTERKFITDLEARILRKVVDLEEIKSSDISDIVPSRHNSERSRVIRRLLDSKMLIPIKKNARVYTLCFNNNYLLRGVIKSLIDNGFVRDELTK
jgi:Fic family protein